MNAGPTRSDRPNGRRRDLAVAAACGAFAAAMVGAAYAAVPLYDWFCRVTGFAGTPQVASAAPAQVLDRRITVRFDGNVLGGLPWKFEPERTAIEVRLGEVVTVNYRVVNEAARETVGEATYNVTPLNIGAYFHKINCFCFTEQRLQAGERREMAVVFYVDPQLAAYSDADTLDTITLSYSFYAVRQPTRPVTDSGRQSGRIDRLSAAQVEAPPAHEKRRR